MKITNKEILLWLILKDKLRDLNKLIDLEREALQLAREWEMKHYARCGIRLGLENHSNFKEVSTILIKRRDALRIKFNKINKKVEAIVKEA